MAAVGNGYEKYERMSVEGRRRWVYMYPDVAIEVDRCLEGHGGLTGHTWDELSRRHPEAIRKYVALKLCSPEMVRKMRRSDPNWEPPSLDALLPPRSRTTAPARA